MSKQDILTVTIVSACVIAIILLVIRLTKASKEETEQPTTTQQEEMQPEELPADTDTSWMEEEALPEDNGEALTDETPEPTAPKATTPTPAENAADTGTPSGKYMVLAGSFTIRANADKLVNRLKAQGYSNARVEIFDRGKYAVVLVDRFDNLNEARDLQQRLNADGVDSYVKLRSSANQ